MPAEYIPVADALSELKPYYPKVESGRVYIFAGEHRIAVRPSWGDCRWDEVCIAIHRAITPHPRYERHQAEDDSTWPPYQT